MNHAVERDPHGDAPVDPPVRIAMERQSRRLALTWRDGRAVTLGFDLLRAQCPCSACRRIRRMSSMPVEFAAVDIVGVESMGYGVQLVFSDGHERGIFPWTLLAQLG